MRYLIYYIAIFLAVACSESDGGSSETTPTPTPTPDPEPPTQTVTVATKSVGSMLMVDDGGVEIITASWNVPRSDDETSIVANATVVNGGALRISFETEEVYSHLVVGCSGETDAFKIESADSFVLLIDQEAESSIDIYISGMNGGVQSSTTYTHTVAVEQVRSDGLQVVLAFDSDEDMDLHLFMPMAIGTGSELYFGNQGLCDEWDDVICGFDVMANNDCQGLEAGFRYESISIPDSYLESGSYTAKVNMYSICTPYYEYSTNYTVCAFYDGDLLAVASGSLSGEDENRTDLAKYTEAFTISLDLTDVVSVRSSAGRSIKLGVAEQAKLYYRSW